MWRIYVDGIPAIGVSDDDWMPLVKASFGRQIDA
jgi:hypothetical protein